MVFLDPVSRLRLQRGAEHLHACGPRVVAEFLADLDHRIGGMPATIGLLAEYQARVSPALLRAVGGDRFPPRPLWVVPR